MTPLDTLTLEASRIKLLAALEREAYPSLTVIEHEKRRKYLISPYATAPEREAESWRILRGLRPVRGVNPKSRRNSSSG